MNLKLFDCPKSELPILTRFSFLIAIETTKSVTKCMLRENKQVRAYKTSNQHRVLQNFTLLKLRDAIRKPLNAR